MVHFITFTVCTLTITASIKLWREATKSEQRSLSIEDGLVVYGINSCCEAGTGALPASLGFKPSRATAHGHLQRQFRSTPSRRVFLWIIVLAISGSHFFRISGWLAERGLATFK
jgi:hypothetical protein